MKEKIEQALNELVTIEFKGNLLLNVPAINTVLKVVGLLTDVLNEMGSENGSSSVT